MALAIDALRARLADTRPRESAVPAAHAPAPARWGWAALSGRLAELSAAAGVGTLTWAVRLVAEAQAQDPHRRPVGWVTPRAGAFYPPDAAANGVALAALAVVRVPDAAAVGRAAERLARSGGFALVVLDLQAAGPHAALPAPLQGRLVQHALRHGSAVLCLTAKPERTPSLGSLVSLRAAAGRERAEGAGGGWRCTLRGLKDKRGGPGWELAEVCHGPPGLR